MADWVSEHVVRAVTTRLTALHVGPEAAAKALEREIGKGFTFVGEVAERLLEFESGDQSFDAFYPRLLGVFDEVARR